MVAVRHLDVWGSICTNGFDDMDAQVICREKGFQGGFAYYQHEYVSGNRKNLPWLSYLNCTGSEGYLARCGNIRWGDVRDCSRDTKAAVYCHDRPRPGICSLILHYLVMHLNYILVRTFLVILDSHTLIQ